MRCLLLLHSATGNTRLVARHAARRLVERGLRCTVHDVGRERGRAFPAVAPDLLGVAFPTMYFWPTLPILAAIDRLPRPEQPTPAFVLATAAGDPGAALHIALERLTARGYSPIAAHWVMAPSNWPQHRAVLHPLDAWPGVRAVNRPVERLARSAWRRWPALRPWAGLLWHRASETLPRDRAALDAWLATLVGSARAVRLGAQPTPPDLRGLHIPAFERLARRYTPDLPAAQTGLRFLLDRCTACGACRRACPTDCVAEGPDGRPRFTTGCVGCYACYNACAHGAVAATGAPPAIGRYTGPDLALRRLFGPAG